MTPEPDGGVTQSPSGRFDGIELRDVALAVLPIVLLVVMVSVLVFFPPFGGLSSGEALPDVSVSHVTLPNDETIVLHVTNNGPDAVSIQQVLVNDAYWDFTVAGGQSLAPLESSTVTIPYHWTPGWDLETALVLESGATVHHTIIAPQPSPVIDVSVLGQLALVGIFVGVIPVILGMCWYPGMRRLPRRWLHAVLALSMGVLTFLAFDAGFEAFTLAADIPGAFDGRLVAVLGVIGTLLLVQATSDWLTGDGVSRLGLAYMVALGIGLHNLAEGLAIGSSFALGRVSLGAFLVIGFMIHNVTEGPAIVAPLADTERPSLLHLSALGVIAGAPVIVGGWIGSAAYSPLLGTLFLAAGVGAILQVDWELASLIRREGTLTGPLILGAFLVGLVVMYATDLLVAL